MFLFRRLQREDLQLIANWLAQPHVETWWKEPYDFPSVEEKYGAKIDGSDPTEVFVVVYDRKPIGMIQRYLFDDYPEWKEALAEAPLPQGQLAGIDYLIGEVDLIGKGLGPRLIDQFVEDTFIRYPEIAAVVTDVRQENRRSYRALEKAGFHRIWEGDIQSSDPSDNGPAYVYLCNRG